MDPLSFAANIIAVVSAADRVNQKLEQLRSLKRAPDQLLQAINEVLIPHHPVEKGAQYLLMSISRFLILGLYFRVYKRFTQTWRPTTHAAIPNYENYCIKRGHTLSSSITSRKI